MEWKAALERAHKNAQHTAAMPDTLAHDLDILLGAGVTIPVAPARGISPAGIVMDAETGMMETMGLLACPSTNTIEASRFVGPSTSVMMAGRPGDAVQAAASRVNTAPSAASAPSATAASSSTKVEPFPAVEPVDEACAETPGGRLAGALEPGWVPPKGKALPMEDQWTPREQASSGADSSGCLEDEVLLPGWVPSSAEVDASLSGLTVQAAVRRPGIGLTVPRGGETPKAGAVVAARDA